jgi:hypothetical protein
MTGAGEDVRRLKVLTPKVAGISTNRPVLTHRINLFCSLLFEKLDRPRLQQLVQNIESQ